MLLFDSVVLMQTPHNIQLIDPPGIVIILIDPLGIVIILIL